MITAIDAASADVRAGKIGPVPAHLRDAHYAGSKKLGHGQGYHYSHDAPYGIAEQQYAPDVVARRRVLPAHRPGRRGRAQGALGADPAADPRAGRVGSPWTGTPVLTRRRAGWHVLVPVVLLVVSLRDAVPWRAASSHAAVAEAAELRARGLDELAARLEPRIAPPTRSAPSRPT